jgi:hypothetical protein
MNIYKTVAVDSTGLFLLLVISQSQPLRACPVHIMLDLAASSSSTSS